MSPPLKENVNSVTSIRNHTGIVESKISQKSLSSNIVYPVLIILNSL